MRAPRPATVLLSLGMAVALPLAACGSDPASEVADSPAALAPAAAPLYAEAVVRPRGEQREAIEALASRFPKGERLGELIVESLDESLAEETERGRKKVTFERHLEPWLGERAGLFVAELKREPDAAMIVAATDEEAARRGIAAGAAADKVKERDVEYQGVEYSVDEDGDAVAFVGGHVAIGSQEAVEDVIDVAVGDEPALADEVDVAALREPSGTPAPVAFGRLDLASLNQVFTFPRDSAQAGLSAPGQGGSVLAAARSVQGGAAAASLSGSLEMSLFAEPRSARLTVVADLPPGGAGAQAAPGLGVEVPDPERTAAVLSRLPADSLAAVAVPRFGPTFAKGFEAGIRAQLGPVADPRFFLETLRRQLGFDPVGLARALGDLGVYAVGSGRDVGGGAVFEVTDPLEVRRAIAATRVLIGSEPGVALGPLPAGFPSGAEGYALSSPEAPQPFVVALDGDRFVAAYGAEAAAQGLAPDGGLGGSALFDAAEEALGRATAPAFVLDAERLFAVAEAFGAAEDRDYRQARPYLEPLELVAAGSSEEDGEIVSSFVVTVGQAD